MIIRWPGMRSGHIDTGFHYHLDLAPTLAELLNKQPCTGWDGKSYAPALLDGRECGRDYLVVSQCVHVCQRSVRFGDWIYIRTYHDGYHLFPEEMLYNLKNDPYEQVDIAEENLVLRKDAVYLLNQWHDDQMKSMPFDTDPLWTVMKEGGPFHAKGHLKEYIEWLKQSERGEADEELMKRHPNEFVS
ncbi:hypothetical protein [Paenibacillus sp. GD4]|uniref:hypothetical protein n=1 Tax=Paenibacillus sp. GD4 TaxID=3068890 RepID=UPI0027B99710|nr:hypothetical protein [Paenibacillus sp. GD4]